MKTVEQVMNWFKENYTEEGCTSQVEYLGDGKFRLFIDETYEVKDMKIPIKNFDKWLELNQAEEPYLEALEVEDDIFKQNSLMLKIDNIRKQISDLLFDEYGVREYRVKYKGKSWIGDGYVHGVDYVNGKDEEDAIRNLIKREQGNVCNIVVENIKPCYMI